MRYRYQAFAAEKRFVQGVIEAASESVAEETLYRAGYRHVLSLREARSRLSLPSLLPSLFNVKPQEIIDFSRQLATLVESGVPLLTALQLLQGNTSKSAFGEAVAGLIEELRAGSSLSRALSQYPEIFPDSYWQMIRASEQVGNLEIGLRQVAGYMEKRLLASTKVKRALTYPAFTVLMAIGVATLLVTTVLPSILDLFSAFDVSLPWTTRLIIGAGNFLMNYRLFLLGGLLVAAISIVGYTRLPAGRLAMDRLMLKLPVVRPLLIHNSMFHFCQSTSMMLKAGLQLTNILDIVVDSIGNRVVRQALREVRNKLVQGEGLSQPLAENDLFPDMLVRMVVVGESTGSIDATMATLADYYQERFDQRITALISMIEPALTVAIGLLVGLMALSIITPMYSLMGSIG